MKKIELIGIPFDGMGRLGGQANAPQVLRNAGLIEAFQQDSVNVLPDMIIPGPISERSKSSGFVNERALLDMNSQLLLRLGETFRKGNFPFIYGGDCSVLLAAIPALRNFNNDAGLLFIDGHEDNTPAEKSVDGDVANMEIGFLLGQISSLIPQQIRNELPALKYSAIAMLGMRDRVMREKLKVPSLADKVFFRSLEDLAKNLEKQTQQAVDHVKSNSNGWWLHIDLDVLSVDEFNARGEPGEDALPGELTWVKLELLVKTALKKGGCRGFSLVIFNPDRDEEGENAQRIIQFVRAISAYLPI